VKPILVLIAVVLAIGLAIPADAFGQGVTQTRELPLTPEQLGEEIAAWKQQLAGLVEDLSDPSKIWVVLRGGTTVATDDEELVQALRERRIMDLIRYAAESQLIGSRDFLLEDKSLFRQEVESFVKETYAELVKQDRAIREDKEREAERLREIIRTLEKKRTDALASRTQQAGTPAFKPDEATVSETEKEAVRAALKPTAAQENWDTRDLDYVLGYLRKTNTPSQLRRVKELIKDFSAIYQLWNSENARIEAAAKAGGWMPGKRIGERDAALRDRNDSLQRVKASFEASWQAP
jgi:hypothetical protein